MSHKAIPGWYKQIKEQQPELCKAVEELGRVARQSGPVDEKTGQLIQIAAGAAMRSEGAVHSHVRRALEAGASAEEIRHTIVLLVSTIGFPYASAALRWAEDVIEG